MNNQDCIFCGIISDKIPSIRIYEDNFCIAILDIFPVSTGHTLLIPKKHYSTIEDIPSELLRRIIVIVKNLGIKIHKKLNVDGYNVIQNNFAAAGQAINHFHIHIIPRRDKDMKLKMEIPKSQANTNTLQEIKAKILH